MNCPDCHLWWAAGLLWGGIFGLLGGVFVGLALR